MQNLKKIFKAANCLEQATDSHACSRAPILEKSTNTSQMTRRLSPQVSRLVFYPLLDYAATAGLISLNRLTKVSRIKW